MGKLSERLAGYPTIGIDTSIFIYLFEDHPTYRPLAEEVLSGVESGQWRAITSVITLMEIGVRPLQSGRQGVARRYEALLVNFPNLMVVDINRDVARRAAYLRAEYRLRPADALQVAACLWGGARAFVSNDRQLARIQALLPVIVLDDTVTI